MPQSVCEYKSSRLKKNRREKLIGCFFPLMTEKSESENFPLERKKEKKSRRFQNFSRLLRTTKITNLFLHEQLWLWSREKIERENVLCDVIFASGFGARSRRRRRRNDGGILEEERIRFRDEASASNRREKIIVVVATTEERGEEEDDLVVVVEQRFIRRRRRLRRRAFAERSRRGRAVGSETRERVRRRVS